MGFLTKDALFRLVLSVITKHGPAYCLGKLSKLNLKLPTLLSYTGIFCEWQTNTSLHLWRISRGHANKKGANGLVFHVFFCLFLFHLSVDLSLLFLFSFPFNCAFIP